MVLVTVIDVKGRNYMNVIGSTETNGPVIPDNLAVCIDCVSTVILNPQEVKIMNVALQLVSDEVKQSKTDPSAHGRASILFMAGDRVSLNVEDHVFGEMARIVFLPIGRWRRCGLTEIEMLACAVEELSHFIFAIPDGQEMKRLVERLVNTVSGEGRFYTYSQITDSMATRFAEQYGR